MIRVHLNIGYLNVAEIDNEKYILSRRRNLRSKNNACIMYGAENLQSHPPICLILPPGHRKGSCVLRIDLKYPEET